MSQGRLLLQQKPPWTIKDKLWFMVYNAKQRNRGKKIMFDFERGRR